MMGFAYPDPSWLPLHEAILTLGHNAEGEIERICASVSNLHDPVMVEYIGEDKTFFVSLRRAQDTASPYQIYIGNFRLSGPNFEFDDTANEATSAERDKVLDAVGLLFTFLRTRLRIQYGRAFIVYARVGSPLAETFSLVPADALDHFAIEDWRRGVGVAVNNDRLFSIYLGPPLSAESGSLPLQAVPPSIIEGKSKTAEFGRFMIDRYDGKQPDLSWLKLGREFLSWKGVKGNPPDRKTMQRGISLAQAAIREGAGK